MINLGLVFVPYVTMPGGKGWWMLIRGIETLERQTWHSHAGAWERSMLHWTTLTLAGEQGVKWH
jgi:hypothetical protein